MTEAIVVGADGGALGGAWSVPLAAGLDLPIAPARTQAALFERPHAVPAHLTVIDSVPGVYARPTADHCTLVGHSGEVTELLDDPDDLAPEPDGRPERPRLPDYALRRFGDGALISGEREYGARAPH